MCSWRAGTMSSHCSSSNIVDSLSWRRVAMLWETAQAIIMSQALSGVTLSTETLISAGQTPSLSVSSFLCGYRWQPSLRLLLVHGKVSAGTACKHILCPQEGLHLTPLQNTIHLFSIHDILMVNRLMIPSTHVFMTYNNWNNDVYLIQFSRKEL